MDAAQVARLRAQLGLSSLQLAERLGVSQELVLAWESGRCFPTRRYVEAMRALGMAPPAAIPEQPERTDAAPSPTLQKTQPEQPQALLEALANPALWRIVRILASNPKLLEQVDSMLAKELDPAQP